MRERGRIGEGIKKRIRIRRRIVEGSGGGSWKDQEDRGRIRRIVEGPGGGSWKDQDRA